MKVASTLALVLLFARSVSVFPDAVNQSKMCPEMICNILQSIARYLLSCESGSLKNVIERNGKCPQFTNLVEHNAVN